MGKAVQRLQHAGDVPGPGVQVVARVPCAGPVPPPSMVVRPEMQRVVDLAGGDEVDVGIHAARGQDAPLPAITSVAGPITTVTPAGCRGLPALPMAWMRPSRRPTSAL